MPNVIELVTKYMPILDEVYKVEARSSILDAPAAFVQETKDAKTIKIAKMDMDGLADYGRKTGFVDGFMELTWQEHTFRIDRGRSLQVDALDNIETFGIAWGRLAGEFLRTRVVPEMDAYRFAEYFKNAGIKKTVALTEDNILQTIDEIDAEMIDLEVPMSGRIIFTNAFTNKLMMNSEQLVKYLQIDENLSKALNKRIWSYNDMPIITVPTNRFQTGISLLTGGTGQEEGGFAPAAGAKDIDLMILSRPSVIQISKRVISRFWAPTRAEMDSNKADGVNPVKDAWKFDFRAYHDAWVLENKVNGIAAVTAP